MWWNSVRRGVGLLVVAAVAWGVFAPMALLFGMPDVGPLGGVTVGDALFVVTLFFAGLMAAGTSLVGLALLVSGLLRD